MTVQASYYQPPSAGKFQIDLPLPLGGSLTLGYGIRNSGPFNYLLRDGQDVDVGFLKLFLTTEPLDFSDMAQASPFRRDSRVAMHCQARISAVWDTILVAVVQRRAPLQQHV